MTVTSTPRSGRPESAFMRDLIRRRAGLPKTREFYLVDPLNCVLDEVLLSPPSPFSFIHIIPIEE